MKPGFDKFYDLLRKDRKKSFFSKSQTIKTRYSELIKEVHEMKSAIKKKDYPNLKEELGDVTLDLFSLMIIAEEKNFFSAKEIVSDSVSKLKRRKPWLLKSENVSAEEEMIIWNNAKQKEKTGVKNGKNKKNH